MDRIDLVMAAEALRAVVALDSPKLARFAIEQNAALMNVASELREMSGGAHPYLPMQTAADMLERIAKGQPGELRINFDVLEQAAADLERLADEPPADLPRNRHERRAMQANGR